MRAEQATAGSLAPAIAHFLKVTANYGEGLFHCYDLPALPPTNNALERCFGALRYFERRATGHRTLTGGLVARGAVRAAVVLAGDRPCPRPAELRLTDRAAWQALRQQLAYRDDVRRAQRRLRKHPDSDLTSLEQQLLQ
jgi:hypothetical protein